MGRNVYAKVDEQGKAIVEHSGYLDFKNTPDGTLIVNQFAPPVADNLKLVPSGKQDDKW